MPMKTSSPLALHKQKPVLECDMLARSTAAKPHFCQINQFQNKTGKKIKS
uniref:Uncharacterized protein n=1 Tax=Arion vulgaris TaxID=1028688 RepID=A0A0B6ZAY3_9EUPU